MSMEYKKSWEKFLDEMGESMPDIEIEFSSGWNSCKDEVLNILHTKIQNADFSYEHVDKRFIELIEKL